MSTNWRSLCRLCAQNDGNELKVETIKSISRIVQKYFRITILTRDDCLLVACHECLHQLQNLDKFALRCVQVNKMFLELFNDSVLCDKTVPLRSNYKHSQLEAPQALEIDDSCAEYLEIEYIQELLQPEHEERDCASSVKSEENDMNDSDNFENMEILGDIVNTSDKEKEDAIDVKYEEVYANDLNSEKNDAINYEDVDESEIIYKEVDGNANFEEDDLKEVNYEMDVPFSDEELDNIEKLDDLNDIKNKEVPKKRFCLKTYFTCDICDMKFSRPTWYEKHMKTKHSQDGGTVEFACEKCPKRFSYAYILKDHENEHLPDNQKQIKCTQCKKTFKSRDTLRQHIKCVHNKEGQAICDECGKVFQQKCALNTHKIVHATARPCQCPKCPKTFKDLTHLKKHMDVHNEDIHECSYCGKRLKTKRVLRDHMVVHFGEKKFKCQFCELVFKRKNTLRRHLVFHTGVRPFSCSFCDKTYTEASRVSYHERMYHTNLYNLRESGKATQSKE